MGAWSRMRTPEVALAEPMPSDEDREGAFHTVQPVRVERLEVSECHVNPPQYVRTPSSRADDPGIAEAVVCDAFPGLQGSRAARRDRHRPGRRRESQARAAPVYRPDARARSAPRRRGGGGDPARSGVGCTSKPLTRPKNRLSRSREAKPPRDGSLNRVAREECEVPACRPCHEQRARDVPQVGATQPAEFERLTHLVLE